jgi:hypothetical protein
MIGVCRQAVAAGFLMVAVLIPVFSAAGQHKLPKSENLRVGPVEVVQVLEQPVNLIDVVLANTDKGYVLKCSISNNLGTPIIGLDYMLLVIDPNNTKQAILSGSEEFKLKRLRDEESGFENTFCAQCESRRSADFDTHPCFRPRLNLGGSEGPRLG